MPSPLLDEIEEQGLLIDELIDALKNILPLAEAYLRSAPTHPDNAKLESARAIIAKVEE